MTQIEANPELLTPGEMADAVLKHYNEYKAEDQTRNERGRLVNPIAELFELRMNRALDELCEFYHFAGKVAVEA